MVKLKASTLIESIIAMVVIVVSTGISSMIYVNVLQSDKQYLQLKATILLNNEVIELRASHNFIDSEKQKGDWTIKLAVDRYTEAENLYQIKLSAIDQQGNTIATHNELLVVEE